MAWRKTTTHAEFLALVKRSETGEFRIIALEMDNRRNATWHFKTDEPSMGGKKKQIVFGKLKP